jgi:uncharacterized ferritin-like protein (DUF455 family)
MELRTWAIRILGADTLEEKLFEPETLTDREPGPPLFWKTPTRPKGMEFQTHKAKHKLPKLHEFESPEKRAVCLHRFAGHELLAVEVMAYALLAFPEAPKHFRRGIANTLREEQEHVRLYLKELARFGLNLEDLPLFKNFWAYTPYLRTPENYLTAMSLTFEMANLDFAPTYGAAFLQNGDTESAHLMGRIFNDEISHVSFGWNWLKKLQPHLPQWEAWSRYLPEKLSPRRAMGFTLNEEGRKKAGVSEEWLKEFKERLQRL